MNFSSLDIRKQEFTRVVRGYDKEEVDAFLQLVANQWQEIVDDLRREGEKTKELNIKLDHYQKVEEALEEALKTARDGAKQTIENAEEKARLVVEKAEARSVGITRDAETERLGIRKDAAKYSVRQKEIVAKLRSFLMSELEILAQYESEAPANYVKLMPAERAELVEDLSSLDQDDASNRDGVPNEEFDVEDVEGSEDKIFEDEIEVPDELLEEVLAEADSEAAEEAASAEAGVMAETSDTAVDSGTKKKKTPRKGNIKDPEVSEEIQKIRRILEDLEK